MLIIILNVYLRFNQLHSLFIHDQDQVQRESLLSEWSVRFKSELTIYVYTIHV